MEASQRTILSHVRDLPNICSLVGLFCSLLAIYFSILGLFHAAMIGMVWAVFFDWSDGIIARKTKGRSEEQGLLGMQLDSLIDVINFGICPTIFLLSYGEFSAWYLPGAFFILATVVIRLSYFNVFGLVDKSTYLGLALDNNVILLSIVFLFNPMMSQLAFSIVLYVTLMILAALNVASIKTPKFAGKWYYAMTGYTVLVSFIFLRQWHIT